MRGVNVTMFNMTTFTGKLMSFTDTKFSALATTLRGISGIDIIHPYTKSLSLVDASLCHHVEKPLRKFSAGATTLLPILANLLDPQILKNKNCIGRNPFAKIGSGFETESSTPVTMFSTQPFQKSTNTFRILLLCLMVRQLFLKTLTCLTSFLIKNFNFFTRNKQSFCISGSHQSIGGTKVYTYRYITFGIRNIKCEAEMYFSATKNSDTVITHCIGKISLGVIRNIVVKFFSTNRSGNGNFSMTGETEVLGKEEKSGNTLERKRFSSRFTILSCRRISTGHVSDGRTFHLGRKRRWNSIIYFFVKFNSRQWFTTIVSNAADRLLEAIVFHNQIQKIGSIFNYKWYGSLNFHTYIIS